MVQFFMMDHNLSKNAFLCFLVFYTLIYETGCIYNNRPPWRENGSEIWTVCINNDSREPVMRSCCAIWMPIWNKSEIVILKNSLTSSDSNRFA